MDTKGGKWQGFVCVCVCVCVTNWEIGIDIYTLIYIKWITNKNLLYKKINKIQKFKKIKIKIKLEMKQEPLKLMSQK